MITYCIPTGADYYSVEEVPEDQVIAAINAIESHVMAYMQKHYPKIEFSTQQVPDLESRNNQSYADDEHESVLQELDDYVEQYWIDWV